MAPMVRSPALRDHVAAGILEVASGVLAERGEATSMTDIAKAAGVARATLYRYFPNREALLEALREAALEELSTRIADAKPDSVPLEDAVARLTRAVMALVGKYRALALFDNIPQRKGGPATPVLEAVQALLERAERDGALRTDLPTAHLLIVYASLLRGISGHVVHGRLGVEEASTAVTRVFLGGVLAT